jgi:hypothetical protein
VLAQRKANADDWPMRSCREVLSAWVRATYAVSVSDRPDLARHGRGEFAQARDDLRERQERKPHRHRDGLVERPLGMVLVVTATNFNDRTWFDSAGNFHSDALGALLRYTRTDRSPCGEARSTIPRPHASVEDPDALYCRAS